MEFPTTRENVKLDIVGLLAIVGKLQFNVTPASVAECIKIQVRAPCRDMCNRQRHHGPRFYLA
jgi:hypothetical protein